VGFPKSLLAGVSSCVTGLGMQPLVRFAEIGASLLQGKGSGNLDLSAEIRAAAACITCQDPVFLDVGAHHGKWALGMMRLFPEAQRVVLCEPQAECVATLRMLELPGKIIVPAAVCDHVGAEPLYVSGAGWFAASLYERRETIFARSPQNPTMVPVTTLDAVLEHEGIETVDFAKFDIEGAELAAFHGASRSFSRGAIGALSLEFGPSNINSRTFFRDFWQFLTDHGFEIFRVLPGGRTLRISQYHEDLEYFQGFTNYVCRNTRYQRSALAAA